MSGLPQGWTTARLDEVCSYPQYGWTCKSAGAGQTKYLRTTDISGGSVDWNAVPFCAEEPAEVSKYQLCADDIVVSRAGSVGVSCRIQSVPCDAVFASYLIRFRAQQGIDPRFVEAFFKSDDYWRSISEFTAGIAVPNVNGSKLAGISLPVPPATEQRRIVAKLEKLLARVDACQRRLEKIPGILKRFRQSVLAAACSGRLTADWRSSNPVADSGETNVIEPRFTVSLELMDEPELPDSWKWIALGNAARCFRGRFTPRPRNDPRFFGGPHPFIQIGVLPKEGGFITTHTQTLNDDGLAVSRKFPAGTTVIAIVGATIGNTGVLTYDTCATDSLVGVESGTPEGNRYLEFYLRHVKQTIREASYSSGGQPNIKLEFLNSVPVALPPTAEQHEIVRRVDALFAFADRIEARFTKAKVQVDKLTPALLAKAFRGELVPQDPGDEPASALLNRIRSGTVSDVSPQTRRRSAATSRRFGATTG